jgi:hypothetical protein
MLKFTYTKANGTVSERVGLIVKPAEVNDLIMDLTDLSDQERNRVENDWNEYKLLHEALLDKFSFVKYFKNFKPSGISDREVI